MYRIGIDLGGTKTEGILLDANGSEVYRKRVPTERDKGYHHILEVIAGLYSDLAERTEGSSHTLGIGTPGAISRRTGLLKNSNTTCMNGMPVLKDLEEKLNRKIAIQNDANCFAMAESLMGAGKGYNLVFGVIMGTGCGGGITLNSRLWEGPQLIAGEWGHSTIDPNHGPECYCGKRGCVETLISGHGVEQLHKKKYGGENTFEKILTLYRQGNFEATDTIQNFFRNFGIALSNVINILDPDIIVLGGGLSNTEELYSLGRSAIKQYIFSDSLETPVVRHKLGDSAGVLGAALIGI